MKLNVACLMLLAWASTSVFHVHAQNVNLNFGMNYAVSNEFGNILPGSSTNYGAMVQILIANAGVYPPDTNGNPNALNPVVCTSYIGKGIDPSLELSGMASDIIPISRSVTNTIFARILNKSTTQSSSFYTDSQLYNVPIFGGSYDIFWINAYQTTNLMDDSDGDNDGLSRSWEMSYGTDANNPDTDNDGMLDGHEILAGTDPNDVMSLLLMVEIIPASGGNTRMIWDSVPGKTYQLEYTTNSLVDIAPFETINGPVTATNITASTIVTNGMVPPTSGFRVRLVVP